MRRQCDHIIAGPVFLYTFFLLLLLLPCRCSGVRTLASIYNNPFAIITYVYVLTTTSLQESLMDLADLIDAYMCCIHRVYTHAPASLSCVPEAFIELPK